MLIYFLGYNHFTAHGKNVKCLKSVTSTISTEEQYIEHLLKYFHDGKSLRTDVIKATLPFLNELLGIIYYYILQVTIKFFKKKLFHV
jgi:hypothetical protein